ncbi:alpha/beta hydrolase [Streptomyces sp. NPDC005708]|uniref:alpha/beta hydrolase n=1 Tax=Streptomyces sp. NPDC005708 TaxID=3154564 RepID=UPI0033CEF384
MRASTSVRRDLAVACAVAATGALAFAAPVTAAPLKTTTAATITHHDAVAQIKPTIVLVHGAWTDTSGRNRVMSRLVHASYTVHAPFVASIPGPVILAGHSDGGMVITNSAGGSTHVRALVYDDANIRDEGETAFQINAAWPGPCITADPSTFLNLVPYPDALPGDADAYLKYAPSGTYQGFAGCFANGVPATQARLPAAGQRPFAVSAGSQPSGTRARKSLPSWAVVGTRDHAIPAPEQLFIAQRARSQIAKVLEGHLSLITRADTIIAASQAAH